MTPRDEATERQVRAADPAASTWLSANAGSGKTRVLIDRVARLLLDGVPPQNILCLTFTKAAASEMQNRLFARLGEWAMAPEAELREKLAVLGAEDRLTPANLSRARTLFARAVETPGGLKIQTIHSFCAAVLRRFPLEAGVPPNFTEMDDRSGPALRDDVVREIAQRHPERIEAVARHLTGDLAALVDALIGARGKLKAPQDRADICAGLGIAPTLTAADVTAEIFHGSEMADLSALAEILRTGGSTDRKLADKITALPPPDSPGAFDAWAAALLNKDGSLPKKAATKAIVEAAPDLCEELTALRERIVAGRDRLDAIALADRTEALHRFTAVFLPAFEAAKDARGWLDFDDLILKTRDLLGTPGVAEWVLFRLDGGIDHILVDEAQDTSPEQWDVIGLLVQEITAGSGRAEAGQRTLFVVGDQKQSIYSFQGADPEEFLRMRDRLSGALRASTGLVVSELEHSFRSAPPILTTVDDALSQRPGLGGDVHHIAFHETMPGRVDVWPLAQPEEGPDDAEWFDPIDRVLPSDAKSVLARSLAEHIRDLIDRGTRITDRDGNTRQMTEGDILILFRGRESGLFDEVISACKHADLAIAGADRMKLTAELAVRDVCALLAFLATPEDDLSLAAALRSPLLGWSEADLFHLAQPRGGAFLWEALRQKPDCPQTLALLHDMLSHADFLRPYELVERLLIRHGGRRNLLARLGPEAEDGIDMLLSQALSYEAQEVPSLTGFLDWLTGQDIAVKRQAEGAGNKIRVMTVHGAKGLESPVVILPDTTGRPRPFSGPLLSDGDGRIFWYPRRDTLPEALSGAVETALDADAAEEERLLYVAMTRAESWLIVAGASGSGNIPDTCWYAQVAEAMERMAAGPLDTPLGVGRRLESPGWPEAAEEVRDKSDKTDNKDEPPVLPDWTDMHAPPAPPGPRFVSPSDLGGAKALPGAGDETEVAMQRGTDLHLLLEHLPGLDHDRRAAAAAALLPDRPEAEREALLAEASAVLDDPALAHLFAPGTLAEVVVASPLPGHANAHLGGKIDRLLLEPDRVTIVDFKSNLGVPDRPEDVPEGLLRQMGAYEAAIAAIYPGRRIESAILWTRTARLMPLPATLAAAALARAVVT